MDAARSRGSPRGRGSAHARRGRGGGRGKAARARGAPTRGMRVPPEYLQRVIAERQGLDPSVLPDENEDEDEDEGKERQYRPRVLETNADRYRELDDGDAVEDDEELAKETARILEKEKMRLRDLSGAQPQPQSQSPGGPSVSTSSINTSSRNGKGRPSDGGDDDDDVDHALGANLMALRGKQTREGHRGKGQVITVEWDERMEVMSKEKAEAEAYAALKARFRGQPTGLASAPSLKTKNVGGPAGAGCRLSGTAGDIGNAGSSEDKLEDFLDELLG